MVRRALMILMMSGALAACATTKVASMPPTPLPDLDTIAADAMRSTGARGLAIAIVDNGEVRAAKAYGARNAAGDPLGPQTIMYGASLTKAVFVTFVMQLVDEGKLSLDQSIAELLPKPLPDYSDSEEDYADYRPLKDDERWRKLTPRILLTHSSGFANFGFLEPDGKLKFHFDPGSRYGYSGDGIMLLQFVIERGLGLNVGQEVQRRIFDRFGMTRTSLQWRADFRPDLADGWTAEGKIEPHDERSRVRAAGSMDTTIDDFARFVAGFQRGGGMSAAARAEMLRPQLPITTASQFPTLLPVAPIEQQVPGLSAGLGVITFTGPQKRGFYKGGHNDSTGNSWVCLIEQRRCVVILSNDVRAEAAFPAIIRSILGETGMPWRWEYGALPWAK